MYLLYKLVFASGKAYIGQTARTMNVRLAQHRTSVRHGSLLPVHCAWRKHGEPEVTVIAEFQTHEELHAAEKAAIIAVGTLAPQGYNVSYGGDTAPSKNPDVAAKIAAKAKGRKIADTSRLSQSLVERWKDDDYRQKVSDGLKASWGADKKALQSEKTKTFWEKRKANGYVMSDETKQKLASYERTAETRLKMSESAKVRKREPRADGTKKKMSSSAASSWQDPVVREKRLAAMKLARERRKQEQTCR